MCSQRPCSSPSCAAIWRMSTSRWESLRKLHACAASRYQAMTCVPVRVMCPSIERSAISGVYFGRFSSPARYRPRRRRGSLAASRRPSRAFSRGFSAPLSRPLSRPLSFRRTGPALPGAAVVGAALRRAALLGLALVGAGLPGVALHRTALAGALRPGGAARHAHVLEAHGATADGGAGPGAADLMPEQLEDLPERALVVD